MKWSWSLSKNDYWSNGGFETKKEAIEDALENINYIKGQSYNENEIIFYIGQCDPIPLSVDVDVDRILEYLDEQYCEESGCDTYIYEGISDEDKKWLEDKFSEIIDEFHKKAKIVPGWFNVVGMETIDLKDVI